jgi:hypothetical protein
LVTWQADHYSLRPTNICTSHFSRSQIF